MDQDPGGPAHPRSRGENNIEAIADQAYTGSSPLTRGKQRESLDSVLPDRLIPAHAGKTESEGVRTIGVSAHPRSRGENTQDQAPKSDQAGSSPLTRGKLFVVQSQAPVPWLIPAHAGKTQGFPAPYRRGTAHPRSRGENMVRISL